MSKSWKIGLHDGKRDKPAIHTVSDEEASKRLMQVVDVIEEVKRKWKLPDRTRVAMVYEAGQDRFWVQRTLDKHGYQVLVIDPASIPVERHARRAKTGRLDAIKLVTFLQGERDRMHVIEVLAQEVEAQRHMA